MKLYIDREGGKFTSWYHIGNNKKRFESSHDLDEILQKAKRFKIKDAPVQSQKFTVAILTSEASLSYYEREDAPTQIKLKESKLREMVQKIIKEEIVANDIVGKYFTVQFVSKPLDWLDDQKFQISKVEKLSNGHVKVFIDNNNGLVMNETEFEQFLAKKPVIISTVGEAQRFKLL